MDVSAYVKRLGGVTRTAATLGVPASSVSTWLSQGRMPSGRAIQLGRMFGLSLDEVADLAGGPRPRGAPGSTRASTDNDIGDTRMTLNKLIERAGGNTRLATDLGCGLSTVSAWIAQNRMPAYQAIRAAPLYALTLDDVVALSHGARTPGRKPRSLVTKGAGAAQGVAP